MLSIAAMVSVQDVFVIPDGGSAGALAELERRKFTAEEGVRPIHPSIHPQLNSIAGPPHTVERLQRLHPTRLLRLMGQIPRPELPGAQPRGLHSWAAQKVHEPIRVDAPHEL